jgi:hypothetical protein
MERPYRIFWLLVLGLHAVVAGAALWLLPGGFPATHPRFWSNWIVPIVLALAVALAVSMARRHRYDLLGAILAGFPIGWAGAAISLRILFPVTFRSIFAVPLAGAVLMGAAWLLTFRRQPMSPNVRRLIWANGLASALFGSIILPLSQRAPAADTRPLNIPMPAMPSEPASRSINGGKLNSRLWVSPGDGSVMVKVGNVGVNIRSLLTFISRSPDGCSTILAPRSYREAPDLRLRSSDQQEDRLLMWYRADYDASLSVKPGLDSGLIVLESFAHLTMPVFSHLNSFCDLEVSGHTRLALTFSPCPEAIVEVLPADYPTGRPLRLAYRDANDRFHVVEATSGEKGPFHELAAGRLTRSEPLGITIHDQGKAVATVVLNDWSAQVGTGLSPTAGWGVPVNAIEFSLSGDAPGSTAGIYLTLAGTSVGRGWDSVGHAQGTYRNRITVEVAEPEEAEQ